MRARPLTLLSAVAAAALVVVAGCEATVHAKAFNSITDPATTQQQAQPQQQLVELLLRAITPTAQPMALPTTLESGGLTGVQARIQQATDQAAASGATLAVAILDRATHQLVSNGNSQIIATASVAKLFIADDLLLREAEGRSVLSPRTASHWT